MSVSGEEIAGLDITRDAIRVSQVTGDNDKGWFIFMLVFNLLGIPEIIYINKIKQWAEKLDTLKQTKYIVDAPKKGLVTKITPRPPATLTLPYKPEEVSLKKTKKKGKFGSDEKIVELSSENGKNKNKNKQTFTL